jgi:8-oxo-dGTP pyrophosphatase MutT (NUDIX family)
MTAPLLRWRVGRKLGRTLYRDEVLVGMVDSPEIAMDIAVAMNVRAAVAAVSPPPPCARCGGAGTVERTIRDGAGELLVNRPCPDCTPKPPFDHRSVGAGGGDEDDGDEEPACKPAAGDGDPVRVVTDWDGFGVEVGGELVAGGRPREVANKMAECFRRVIAVELASAREAARREALEEAALEAESALMQEAGGMVNRAHCTCCGAHEHRPLVRPTHEDDCIVSLIRAIATGAKGEAPR